LAAAVDAAWPSGRDGTPYVVCTGGEPLLQLDDALVAALHRHGFEVAVETNGAAGAGGPRLDLSVKGGAPLVQQSGASSSWCSRSATPARTVWPPGLRHFFLQPMDGPLRDANTQSALRYCLDHPRWRMSLQTHKLLGIP
jgi:organic radical activating enzyme